MSNLSATTIARTSQEPAAGLLIATAYVPAAGTNDTIDVSQVFPNISKVVFATINGTSNHAPMACDLSGTANVTLGTGGITEGEMLIIATTD